MQVQQAPIRVLIVDDESVVADTLALILRGRGFDSRAVYSGEDAAEIALTWLPNVVISDVIMEEMDGVALGIYLAQTLPSCQVILMSGNAATEPLINESRKIGHNFPIFAKPFHPQNILEFLASTSAVGNA